MPGVSTASLSLLFFLSLLLFLCPADSFSINKTSCDAASTFPAGSPLEMYRKTVLDSLVANASVSRFSVISFGRRRSIYGLMRCRAYVSTEDCRTCVEASAQDIVRQCPNQSRASALYDYCSIQYSDSSFFSEADTSFGLSWTSPNNASDMRKFDGALGDLMSNLSQNASTSPLRTAAADSVYTGSATIHAMVQCSMSLDDTNCSKCLQVIISQIPGACPEKDGCRVVTLSCDLRYEDFPFDVAYEQWLPPLSSGTDSTTGTAGRRNAGRGRKSIIIIIIVATVAIVLLAVVCGLICFFLHRRKKTAKALGNRDDNNGTRSDQSMKPLSIRFRTLKTATSNFSDANKIGEGGFGPVYKGILPDGQQIAVKRLSNRSSQGTQELKTEVILVAKLLHRNLVRLIGFCLEEEEQLLVYEFLQNRSLDKILFDEEEKRCLNWESRNKIIVGIARGLQYLHEDSHLSIIHRDLKASNVLLDQDMNPKISDFGLAKLFPGSQTQGLASRIAGTCGYMAPEYISSGHISTKCDVYSYGVLVLEIMTGRKNSSFAESINLPNHAWRHWTRGTPLEIMDPTLEEHLPSNKVLKCIQIGLLCTQDSAPDRPTMSEVVLMLSSDTVKNPAPKQPAFSQGVKVSGSLQVSGNDVTISEVYPR